MQSKSVLLTICIITSIFFPGLSYAQNYAISLPGGSNGSVSNIAIPALNLTELPVTIEAWYKPVSYNAYGGIVYYRGASTDGGIQYDKWTNNKTLRAIRNSSGQVVANNEPTPNEWNHVACVFTNEATTIYLNGIKTTASLSGLPLTFDAGIYIGWDAAIADRTINGLFDEIRIWNTARSETEINENKYNTLNGTETGLVGYWNFDDQATVATDLSPNANHGTINGGTYAESFSRSDADEDGIPDFIDNCPDTSNTDQADADYDGIGDVCDDELEGEGIYDIVTNNAYVTASGANFVSFQQNAILSYKGYQYITFWNKEKQVCLSRKKLPEGNWQTIALTDYTSAHDLGDNHYNISFGICKNNGTIHIAFDHHNDPLHYRISTVDLINDPDNADWSADAFSETRNYLVPGQAMIDNDDNFDGGITYPRFISKPDGDLLFECRTGWSGDGNSHLWEYNGSDNSWSHIGEYLHGRSEGMPAGYINNCGYINGLHYTPGGTRLHVSLVWRDSPDANTNHDICYAYSDDDGRTWYNSDGVLIGTTGSSDVSQLLNLYSEGFQILQVDQNRGLINQEGQAIDSKGGIHILQSYLKDGVSESSWYDRRVNAFMRHIYQDDNGVWQNDIIAASRIDRGDIAVDAADNLYVLGPDYRVYYAKADEKWATWYDLDLSQDGKAVAEGLFDRELLLENHILSFAEAHSDLDGKIIVPHYSLTDYGIETSISESKPAINNTSIACYPNPFLSDFQITIQEKVRYQLSDLNGKIVLSGYITPSEKLGNTLKPGVYFLTIISGSNTSTFKIIKR